MASRGPAPTPKEVLKLRGSWRAQRKTREPQPEPGTPDAGDLAGAELDIWNALIATLAPMKVLTKADGPQLRRYAILRVQWEACRIFLRQNPVNPPKPSRRKKPRSLEERVEWLEARLACENRWTLKEVLAESHRLDRALKQIEANFGLTPSARARITIPEEKPPAGASAFARAR